MSFDDDDDQCYYQGASIIRYGCGEKKQHQVSRLLEELRMCDQHFEKGLRSNDRLQALFGKVIASHADNPLQVSDLQDEVDRISMLYIEQALLSRARFACTQKHELMSRYNKDFPSEAVKEAIENLVNSDLRYVSDLLEGLTNPEMILAKVYVDGCLELEFGGDSKKLELDFTANTDKDGTVCDDVSQDETKSQMGYRSGCSSIYLTMCTMCRLD